MKRIYYLPLIVSILFILDGCGKSYLSSLQNNPNSPTTSAATPQLILPGTITGITNIINSTGYYQEQAVWIGYWNYSGGYSFNYDVATYLVTTGTPSPVWDAYYSNLTNLNAILLQTKGISTLNYYTAAADILESICYQNLVDVYGDVPYSKALQGAADFFPTYDKATAVYDGIVGQLDTAIALIQAGNASTSTVQFGTEDILFAGDMSLWVKFANTMKLKILLRESAVSSKQSYISTELSNTASVGYLGLGQDALANPGFTASQPSPMYGAFGITAAGDLGGSYNYIRAGAFAMNFYKNTNDPRLGYFYATNGDQPVNNTFSTVTIPEDYTQYNADLFGIQATSTSNGSGIGPGIVQSAGQSAVVMLASESLFLQAEAAVRGLIGGSAQTLYQEGIKASFEYLGIPNADALATSYYSQTGVANVSWPAGSQAQIQAIITQKWAALNGISTVEGWNDWRRTGFPIVPLSAYPQNTQTHMPYRYLYPITEPNNNPSAWNAAGGASIDPFNTKIFWMP